MEVKQSLKTPLEKQRMFVIGAMNQGKTFCAASLSQYFDPTFEKPADLKDMFWFKFDDCAFDGFVEKQLNVPHFDFTSVKGDKDLTQALKEGFEHVRKNPPFALVLDTLSGLDKQWFASAWAQYGKQYGLYDYVTDKHRRLYLDEIKTLPCHVILLVHSKSKSENAEANPELKGFTQVMDLTGQSGNLYRLHSSFIVPIMRVDNKGKPPEFSLYPRGIGGIETKCKFSCLSDKEPANLRAIYNKIVQSTKQQQQTEGKAA